MASASSSDLGSMSERPATEDLLRELAPQVLGMMMRRSGGLDTAEDAVQEALIAAARHWPADGVPDNPRAWLLQVATRRLTDQIRSDQARRRREVIAGQSEPAPQAPARDDTLTLLFMCCHPVLPSASASALPLRAVGGLTTAEIASAFLVPEQTMAQRISRAKQRIKVSGVPFSLPAEDERAERLRSVLHVLYLISNEGYVARSGPALHRRELSGEAIRLTRDVHAVRAAGRWSGHRAARAHAADRGAAACPDRRRRRAGAARGAVDLPGAVRDQQLIAEGVALAVRAMTHGPAGDYQIQAAIAALHTTRRRTCRRHRLGRRSSPSTPSSNA